MINPKILHYSFIRAGQYLRLLLVSVLLIACDRGAHVTKDQPAAENGKRIIASITLPLAGTNNTRDLGGYTTNDGRVVKAGTLFRSDSLAHLTDSDLSYLEQLHLAAITDFRSDAERAENPNRLPEQSPPIKYDTLDINNPALDAAVLGKKIFAGQVTGAELNALLDRKSYITDPALRAMWGQWVRDLAQPENLPHLFHCTAGKDRTGYAAALVLLTLGVSKQQVMEDFLLSNQYLQQQIENNVERIQANATAQIDADTLRGVLGVSPSSLESAFQAMEAEYGTIDEFIENGLGIDQITRQRLKTLLLE